MKIVLSTARIMRATAIPITLVTVAALAGCAAPSTPPQAESTPTATIDTPKATPSATPTRFTVSERATCTLLIGPDEDGPLIQYINEITSVDAADTTAVANLITLQNEIKDAAKTASPEIRELVDALFSEDVNDFKAAGIELLTRCE